MLLLQCNVHKKTCMLLSQYNVCCYYNIMYAAITMLCMLLLQYNVCCYYNVMYAVITK